MKRLGMPEESYRTIDFSQAACARAEHAHHRDIWTLDYHELPPSSRRSKRIAIEVCINECPLLAECAAYALKDRMSTGIWGGMDESMREALRLSRGIA